jgi:outer membrane protein
MRKAGLLILLVSIIFAFSAPAWSADLKIGYANLQVALNECQAGQAAKESLKQEAQDRESELQVKQEELKKLKEEIDKKASVWNKETLREKEDEFKARSQSFQQQFMAYGEELNKKKQVSEARIIGELRDVVEELAEKGKYSYIFEKSVGGLLYAPEDADITDDVIELYDKKFRAR